MEPTQVVKERMPPHGWRRSLAPWAHFRRSSFRAAPTTFICVLSWERELGRIAEDFLFIPSGDVAGIARVEGKWMVLEVALGSTVLLLA